MENDDVMTQCTDEVRQYFKHTEADKDRHRRVDVALRYMGRRNGEASIELRAKALAFQIARTIGMKGAELRPLMDSLMPASAPVAIEAQNAESKD